MAGSQTLAELFVEVKLQNQKLLTAMQATEKDAKTRTKKMQGFFDKLNFKALIAGSFGIYAVKRAISGMIKSFSDFEYQMARVNTILQLSSEGLHTLSVQSKEAALAIGVSPAGFASAEYEAISAGVKLNDVIAFTTAASKLAVAGFTDTRTAVNLLTTVQNAYGAQVGNVKRISDQLLDTQNKGKVIIPEMAQSYGRLIPVAAQLGINFEVLNGAVSTMTASGIDMAEAATALRRMMVALATPSEEQIKLWNELRIQWGGARLRGDGLIETVKELSEKTKGNLQTMTQLGINQRALIAVLALGGEAFDKFTKNIEDNGKALGLTEKSFAEMEKTMTRRIERLKASWEGLTGAMGGFFGMLEERNHLLRDTADAMNKLTELAQDPMGFLKMRLFPPKAGEAPLGLKMHIPPGGTTKKPPPPPPPEAAETADAEKKAAMALAEFHTEVRDMLETDEEKRLDNQIKRLDERVSKEFEIQQRISTINANRIEDETERSLKLAEIQHEANLKEIEDREDFLYLKSQLEEEYALKIEDINRQRLTNMQADVGRFANRYGDYLGRMLIESRLSFSSIGRAFTAMLAEMTAQILARAAIWSILGAIMPGQVAAPSFRSIVKKVTGFQGGGFTGFDSPTKPVGMVHGQEFVFPKPAVDTLGTELLNALKNIGTGTTDNRSFSMSFTDKILPRGKEELANNIRELWREGSLNFMG